MIPRLLNAALSRSRKSVLLLGPRQTGKSTLVAMFQPDLTINLAHEPTFLEFLRNPYELEQRLQSLQGKKSIFIDEVQRLPSLLNTLQTFLDTPGHSFRFFLTGSSARKLKRGHANLLPGRIHTYYLGPLVALELKNFQLKKSLSVGTLPGVWTEAEPTDARKTLRSYAATYLKEEVQAENLARNLEGFARFLDIAAQWSGQFLDLAKLASLAQIPRQSAVRFFEILEDCLLVVRLDALAKSTSRRLVQHPKFYFFDVGILNGLLANFEVSQDRIGSLFEHLMVTQIVHTAHALDQEIRLSTYRTEHGAEIDVILEKGQEVFAIEIKATPYLRGQDLRGFKSFSDYYGRKHRRVVLYLGKYKKKIDNVELWPWQEGLQEIFSD